jgi:hypothetical protein
MLSRCDDEDFSRYEMVKPAFSDVGASEWYTLPVAWGAANGIARGNPRGFFGPQDSITREQLATMLHRYAEYKGMRTEAHGGADALSFADMESVSGWAMPAIRWAVETGVIQGRGNGILAPKDSATRAETAAILMRVMEHTD